MTEISNILLALTSNQSWYSEVFDDEIVEKWREEAKNIDLFLLAIRILRTTAQGVCHSPNCEWTPYHCHECNLEFLKEEKDNYEDYGYDTYEEFSRDALSLDSARDPCFANLDAECNHERCSCVSPCYLLEDYVEYTENSSIQTELREFVARLKIERNDTKDLIDPGTQWLPSDVKVEGDKAKFESSITNFGGECFALEQALSSFLPSLRKVLRKEDITRLQVIVRLSSSSKEENVWRTEGLPRERIVATCVQYIEVGEEVSYIEFNKPNWINIDNVRYEPSDYNYLEKHFGTECSSEGEMNKYLGAVEIVEGRRIVFPNTLQFVDDQRGAEERTTLTFFVVDPDNRTESTANVSDQHLHFETAKVMKERKNFSNMLSEEVYDRQYYVEEC